MVHKLSTTGIWVHIENFKRSKKRIEEESKRKMEEHQRKLLAETERKLMDTKSRAQRDLMTKEEKLACIRGISWCFICL